MRQWVWGREGMREFEWLSVNELVSGHIEQVSRASRASRSSKLSKRVSQSISQSVSQSVSGWVNALLSELVNEQSKQGSRASRVSEVSKRVINRFTWVCFRAPASTSVSTMLDYYQFHWTSILQKTFFTVSKPENKIMFWRKSSSCLRVNSPGAVMPVRWHHLSHKDN